MDNKYYVYYKENYSKPLFKEVKEYNSLDFILNYLCDNNCYIIADVINMYTINEIKEFITKEIEKYKNKKEDYFIDYCINIRMLLNNINDVKDNNYEYIIIQNNCGLYSILILDELNNKYKIIKIIDI